MFYSKDLVRIEATVIEKTYIVPRPLFRKGYHYTRLHCKCNLNIKCVLFFFSHPVFKVHTYRKKPEGPWLIQKKS